MSTDSQTVPEKKKPRAKVAKSWSVKQIMEWSFKIATLPSIWVEHLGNLPQRFIIYVDGDPKNGKTEYCLMLAKMFAMFFGKVSYNNVEQGKHKQVQDAIGRNNFNEIPPGKFIYRSIRNFDTYKKQLKRPNSGVIQFFDSISAPPAITAAQIQELIEEFPNKSFVFIGYKKYHAQNVPIIHLCDIEINIANFIASAIGRFGGNREMKFYDPKKAGGQLNAMPEAQTNLFTSSTDQTITPNA